MLKKKEEKKPEPPKIEEKKTCQSGSLNTVGYKVEAKVDFHNPDRPLIVNQPHGEMVLTDEWRVISFFDGNNPAGVPTSEGGFDRGELNRYHMLPKASAIALAYTFAAQNKIHSLGAVKVRLVEYKVEVSHRIWENDNVIELKEHWEKHDAFLSGAKD